MIEGETECTRPDQEDVVGLLHDEPCHLGGMLDPLERRHATRPVGRAGHAARVQLDDSQRVGEPAISDRVVVGIGLDQVDPLDHRVEGIGAPAQNIERPRDRRFTVSARDDDRTRADPPSTGGSSPGSRRFTRSGYQRPGARR